MGKIKVGKLIREAREERGLPLEALSNATGLPVRTLEQIEAGTYDQRTIKHRQVVSLARRVGLNTQYVQLLFVEDD